MLNIRNDLDLNATDDERENDKLPTEEEEVDNSIKRQKSNK